MARKWAKQISLEDWGGGKRFSERPGLMHIMRTIPSNVLHSLYFISKICFANITDKMARWVFFFPRPRVNYFQIDGLVGGAHFE